MTVSVFGRVGGSEILEITLRNAAGAEARIITWGGVLRDLVVPGPGGPRSVVLGLDRIEDYVRYSPFFGAVVGRYANRIGRARFRLGGREIDLVANENGNELHGGPNSFGRRVWSLLDASQTRATLALISPDGDMGYPGRLVAVATYELAEPATLRVVLEAFTDAPTPVNLTVHNYFNLDGAADARGHRLRVLAAHVTPTDAELIPTGAIESVAGTRLDLRAPVRLDGLTPYRDMDINYVLTRERSPTLDLAHAATLSSEVSRIAMELWTTEPGLQVYDGHLVDVPVPGRDGRPYRPYAGIALEPQRFPDAPNRSYFPPCILMPDQVSRQTTEFRFGALET